MVLYKQAYAKPFSILIFFRLKIPVGVTLTREEKQNTWLLRSRSNGIFAIL